MTRLLILILSLLPFAAMAQESSDDYLITKRPQSIAMSDIFPGLPKHVQEFALTYEKVKRLKDKKLLDSLIHPASLACENADTKDYFDHMREFYLGEDLPGNYEFQLVPVAQKKQEALRQRLKLPVAPTHIMYIEFQDIGWQRFLREETEPKKRMYEVVQCPDQATIDAVMKEEAARRRKP